MSSVSRISKSASEASVNGSKSVVEGSSRSSEYSKEASKGFAAKRIAKRTGQPADVVQVIEKLKKRPEYNDSGPNELKGIANDITDNKCLTTLFSHLFEDTYDIITDAVSDDEDLDGLASPTEHTKKQERAKGRMEDMCDLPIKLYLRELAIPNTGTLHTLTCGVSSFLRCRFGPLHAALRVGDVLIEWDCSSLVIPRRVCDLSPEERQFFFMADIRHSSQFHRSASPPKTTDSEIEILISKNADKVQLIDNLVEVIRRYNRKYYYNPVSRNCQKFVLDAAEALGIKDKLIFKGRRLKNHFEDLKVTGRTKGLKQSFANHVELDAYIMNRELEKDDLATLEYLNAVYFHFHYDRQEEEDEVVQRSPCKIPGCMRPRLVTLLTPCLKQLQAEEEAASPTASFQVSI